MFILLSIIFDTSGSYGSYPLI